MVDVCAELNSVSLENTKFSVFPNPTKGRLSIKTTSNALTPVNLEVIDVSGKRVFEQQIVFNENDKTAEVNISSLAAGTYFVKLTVKDHSSEQIRIIKE